MNSICISRRGIVRSVNQDRAAQFSLESCGLFFVADGMGGHYGGERASQTVFSAFTQWWETYLRMPQRPGFVQGTDAIRDVIERCHREIKDGTPEGQLCGTTLTLLWINHGSYAVFSIGDSRCYQTVKRMGFPRVIQLTRDDIVEHGTAKRREDIGKLSRALGVGENDAGPSRWGYAAPNDMFALCTDGVYKSCSGRQWSGTLRKAAMGLNLEKAGERISQTVVGNGAPDNYSFILVKV